MDYYGFCMDFSESIFFNWFFHEFIGFVLSNFDIFKKDDIFCHWLMDDELI